MDNINKDDPLSLPLIETKEKEEINNKNKDNNEIDKEKKEIVNQPENKEKPLINLEKFLNQKTERENDKKNEDDTLFQPPIKKPALDLPKLTPKNEEEQKKTNENNNQILNKELQEPINKTNASSEPVSKEAEVIKPANTNTNTNTNINTNTTTNNNSNASNNPIIDNLCNMNKSSEIATPLFPIPQNVPILKPILTQPPSFHQQNVNEPISNNQNITPQIIPIPDPPVQSKKMMSFAEAKKEIDDFSLQLEKLEKEIKEKYSISFPDSSYEDQLPDDIKIKLVENYFESPEIKELFIKTTSDLDKLTNK